MKFLRRIIEKHASRLINDHFAKSIKPRLSASRILQNRFVVGKRLMPLENSKGFYVIPKHPALAEPGLDGLPVPPQDLWEGYGRTPEQYLQLGREHTEQMIRILRAQGAAPDANTRVLDFGCAAGRMLRFMPALGNAGERWGVDLKAQTISWCQQYLSPPMLFAPCSTVPHLPFEDNYFDLVYAGSVFTHISDSPDTWFLELRRVVRKGGYLYLTIFDKQAHRVLQTKYRDRADLDLGWFVDLLERFNRETSALESDYGMFSFEGGNWGGFPVPQVGFDVDFLTDRWGRLARVASVNPEGLRLPDRRAFPEARITRTPNLLSPPLFQIVQTSGYRGMISTLSTTARWLSPPERAPMPNWPPAGKVNPGTGRLVNIGESLKRMLSPRSGVELANGTTRTRPKRRIPMAGSMTVTRSKTASSETTMAPLRSRGAKLRSDPVSTM